MLHLMESHRFRIHWRANRKIQWFESKNRNSSNLRNQGSASSKALRLSKGRDDPELLHHAESVPADVRIHNLSIDEVIDGDSFHVHFLVCGGNSHEFTGVSAGNCPGDGQLFFFVNDVFNCEVSRAPGGVVQPLLGRSRTSDCQRAEHGAPVSRYTATSGRLQNPRHR